MKIKNGTLVVEKKRPPTFEERLQKELSPLPFYSIQVHGDRATVTVYKDKFVLLDVRAPRRNEGPHGYAIAVREALRGMS